MNVGEDDAASTSGSGESTGSSAASGLSQWLGRVLGQLSLTSWMPAAMLVGIGALIVALHIQIVGSPKKGYDVGRAMAALTENALGTAVVLLVAIVLAATITQAFGFGAIRVLEGYWPGRGLSGKLLTSRTAAWLARRNRTEARSDRQWAAAFAAASSAMRSTGIRPAVVAAIEDIRRGSQTIDATYAPDVVSEARQIPWRLFAPPGELQAAERSLSDLAEFPAPHRVLPMRLGNVLRSQEDRLVQAGNELEGFVMRRYSTVPTRLLVQHDEFRTRLEMYCTFVPVFLVLAVLAAALLTWPGGQFLVAATFTVLLAALGLLSYRAAIASAHGYCAVLAAMATYPEGVSSGS